MRSSPDLSTASDQELAALARQGREQAYREIVRRYRPPVLALIFRIVDHRERAQDLTQDTFVKAFSALDGYHPGRRFAPWILRIARNTALDYVKQKRVDSVTSPYVVTPGHADRAAILDIDSSTTPAPRADGLEVVGALEGALLRLRREHRRCLILHYVEQRSYDDIAAIMRLPRGTVKSHVSRARKQLKNLLAPMPAAPAPDPARTPA